MDTPVQPAGVQPASASAEPGVVSASSSEGASFLTEALTASGQLASAAPTSGFVAPTPPPVAPADPQVPAPVVPSAPAAVVPPSLAVGPAQPGEPVAPSPVDFGSRYSGEPSVDPLAGLQEAPALPPEQQVAQPQNLTEQQNHAWATIRAQSTANRRAAEEYRQKYNQLVEASKKYQTDKTALDEQLAQRDTRIRELEDEIGRVDLTRSTAFREKYDAPLQEVFSSMARTLRENGVEGQQAEGLARRIMEAERQARPELLSQLPSYVQGMLMIEAEKSDGLLEARGQALSEWRQTAEGLATVAQRGDAVVAAKHVDQMVEKAIDIVHTMPVQYAIPAYQVVDPQFVADRTAQEQKFRAWVSQAPEEQRYAAMFEGFMAPKTYEMLEQTMRENQQLRAALAARGRFAAPPVAGTPVAPPVLAPAAPPPAPTVAQNGFSEAPAASTAQQFAAGIVRQYM